MSSASSCRSSRCRLPGIEMSAQVLDITRRYRADFVLSHLFGRAPSVSMKEFKRAGYPLEKVLGFVWAGGEADIAAAGGFDRVEGLFGAPVRGRRQRLPGA